MKSLKIKGATIARIVALIVASINEFLVLFGKDVLPISDNMAYQIVSLLFMVVVAAINAWYNNDISKVARICGWLFYALKDKKITEEELDQLMRNMEESENDDYHNDSTFVSVANWLLKIVKNRTEKTEEVKEPDVPGEAE